MSLRRRIAAAGLAALLAGACSGAAPASAPAASTQRAELSANEVATKTLEAMARHTLWMERRIDKGLQRTSGQNGKAVDTKLDRTSTHAFQAPDRVDSTFTDAIAAKAYRTVDIGTTRYYQEPAGTGAWRSLAIAATHFENANVSISALMRMLLQGDKLRLGDIACGSAVCFKVYTPEGPFSGDAEPATFVIELVVEKSTFLATRSSVRFTYLSDGQGYSETIEYYDYGRDNDIRAPK